MIKYLETLWYKPKFKLKGLDYLAIYFLLLFSFIYKIIFLFNKNFKIFLKNKKFNKNIPKNIPVIIIGNITLGGTGKTPLIIYLINLLKSEGFNPGVISRGYLGDFSKKKIPQIIDKHSLIKNTGDEPFMIFSRFSNQDFNLPMVVGVDRAAARDCLIKNFPEVNIILSDDGLSHYGLDRDLEIIVIDGERKFGNGFLIPAGPLREPVSRLKKADFLIVQNASTRFSSLPLRERQAEGLPEAREGVLDGCPVFSMTLEPQKLRPIFAGGVLGMADLSASPEHERPWVHAVAGIGNPDRFFKLLESLGFKLIKHIFPDHHDFKAQDLIFNDLNNSNISNISIITTEKDMVKIINLKQDLLNIGQDLNHYFYLEVSAEFSAEVKNLDFNFDQEFINKIKNLKNLKKLRV